MCDLLYLFYKRRVNGFVRKIHILIEYHKGIQSTDMDIYFYLISWSFLITNNNIDCGKAEFYLEKAFKISDNVNSLYGMLFMELAIIKLKTNDIYQALHYKDLAQKSFLDNYNLKRLMIIGLIDTEINLRLNKFKIAKEILKNIKPIMDYGLYYKYLMEAMVTRIAIIEKDMDPLKKLRIVRLYFMF